MFGLFLLLLNLVEVWGLDYWEVPLLTAFWEFLEWFFSRDLHPLRLVDESHRWILDIHAYCCLFKGWNSGQCMWMGNSTLSIFCLVADNGYIKLGFKEKKEQFWFKKKTKTPQAHGSNEQHEAPTLLTPKVCLLCFRCCVFLRMLYALSDLSDQLPCKKSYSINQSQAAGLLTGLFLKPTDSVT